MLEAIRKHSSGIIVKGLLALLIISFAMWGIADVFSRSGGDTAVAKVGGVEIRPELVRRDFQQEVERLSRLFGTPINNEQARSLGVTGRVLNRIVDRTLFDLAANGLGSAVSDDLVRQKIRGYKGFEDANGKFDQRRYLQALQSSQLSVTGFEAQARNDILRAQYLSIITAAPAAPKRISEILFAHRNEKRVARVLSIPYSSITVPGQPDDAQLAEFHSKNAAMFTAPETRKLTFISLTADDLAKEIAISDKEISDSYENRKDEFVTPESRVLRQIRLSDEKTAKKAYAMLQGGDDFATVAKDLANMSPAQLDLGAMTRDQLPPVLADAAFSLQPGGFSKPLKSAIGWYILDLVKIVPQAQQSLSDVRKKVSADLAKEKAINSLYKVSNSLQDKLGGGATLEEAAKALNLPLRTIPAIDRTGDDAKAAKVAGLPQGNFLDVAFKTPEGEVSQLIEAGSDGYFIVRTDKVTPPTLRSLESVRDKVAAAWTEKQRAIGAKKLAADLVAKVKAGGRLEKLAGTMGLTVVTTAPFTRNQRLKEIPPTLVKTLFAATVGDTSSAVGDGAYVVARLEKVIAANPVVGKDKIAALRKQLSSDTQTDLIGELAGGLRRQYPVTINSAALNSLF